jgi:ubiquinone/menaquinone biosynthesis C-methylase UbiE
MLKQLVSLYKQLDNHATGLSIKLVKWTSKSKEAIHPKHLISNPGHHWYLDYLVSDDRVLDVGCGNGMHTLKAGEYCREIVGIDYSPHSLDLALRFAESMMVKNVRFQRVNLEHSPLPFADSSFDKVLFLDVIEHLEEREKLLKEIKRVLKPGGLLLLTAPNRETSWKRFQRKIGLPSFADPDHKVEYDKEKFLRELSRAGFRLKGDLMPIVCDTPFAGWIDLVGGISLSLYAKLARRKREYVKKHPEETTGWRAVVEVLPL